jgi:hypothetical protein
MPLVFSSRGILTQPTGAPGAITKVQQSTNCVELFSVGSWSPATTTLSSVVAGNLVLSMGIWWNSTNIGAPQDIPTDSNGTLVGAGAANPNAPANPTPAPGWPVAPQICYIANANSGNHVLTPLNLGGGGDGYFFGVEFQAAGATWSLVDSGVAFSGSSTPGAVQSLTVNTAGTAAIAGDLVVALIAIDGDPTAFGLGAPTGYTVLLTTSTTNDNVSGGGGWKTASAGGTQSASWAWSDSATEMAHGVIAVFRRA